MGASLLVLKNKSDVPDCMSEEDIRQVCTAPRWRNILLKHVQGLRLDSIRTHKWHILPCSAMTGQNLQEGLQWVVQDAKDRLFLTKQLINARIATRSDSLRSLGRYRDAF